MLRKILQAVNGEDPCEKLYREYLDIVNEYRRYVEMGASPQSLFMQELGIKLRSKYIEYLACASK